MQLLAQIRSRGTALRAGSVPVALGPSASAPAHSECVPSAGTEPGSAQARPSLRRARAQHGFYSTKKRQRDRSVLSREHEETSGRASSSLGLITDASAEQGLAGPDQAEPQLSTHSQAQLEETALPEGWGSPKAHPRRDSAAVGGAGKAHPPSACWQPQPAPSSPQFVGPGHWRCCSSQPRPVEPGTHHRLRQGVRQPGEGFVREGTEEAAVVRLPSERQVQLLREPTCSPHRRTGRGATA